jgi:predicted nucleic acid-binding protein
VTVIDASALAKYVFKEEGWREVHGFLERGALSVDLIVKEVANAIWRRTFILKVEGVELASRRYQLLIRIARELLVLENELSYLDEAFRIAVENGLTVYDSLYIAQAHKRKVALLTSDRRQAEVARKLGLHVHYIP